MSLGNEAARGAPSTPRSPMKRIGIPRETRATTLRCLLIRRVTPAITGLSRCVALSERSGESYVADAVHRTEWALLRSIERPLVCTCGELRLNS